METEKGESVMLDVFINDISCHVERVVSMKVDEMKEYIMKLVGECAMKEQLAGIEKRLNAEHTEILDLVNQNAESAEDIRLVFEDKIQEIRNGQEEAKRAEEERRRAYEAERLAEQKEKEKIALSFSG